jgi:hypothetical protein
VNENEEQAIVQKKESFHEPEQEGEPAPQGVAANSRRQ